MLEEVRRYFRPEFLNRLDDIIVFRSLSVAEIKKIVQIQLLKLGERLRERHITLELADDAVVQIASAGFDPVYGARPLKRAIQAQIMNPLAQAILRGDIREGQTVLVDYANGEYRFDARTPEPVGS